MSFIYVLLGAHFIGDFVLQTTWMARHKGRSLRALVAHVGCYTIVLAAGALAAWSTGLGEPTSPAAGAAFLAVNSLAHLCQDAVTSRLNARVERGGRAFFIVLGADQMVHYVVLCATAQYWLEL
jgi:hypothetical protein